MTTSRFARPFASKPDLADPSGSVLVWLTKPAGMVDHVVPGRVFTDAMARFLVGPATEAMFEVGRSTGVERFRFVHDWRGVESHESAARTRLIDWGRRLRPRIDRIDIAIAPDAPALFRMAVHGGAMVMSIISVTCTVSTDVEVALRNAGVHPLRAPH